MVTALVLFSAILHASWNALGKSIRDPMISAGLIGVAYFFIGGTAALFLPLPDPASWPFVVVSVAIQTVYLLFLMTSYEKGDMGRIYPIARGVAPLLVVLVSMTLLSENLGWLQLAGIAVLCSSLGVFMISGGRVQSRSTVGLAIVTGILIAGYTLVDGVGVRVAGNPISYAMWLFLLQGPLIPLLGFAQRGRIYAGQLCRHLPIGLLGGLLSLVAYAVVVWAQSQAPMAEVAALRETSIIFAALIGAVIFKEKLGVARTSAAFTMVGGIVLIQLV